ncbi:MAG TPA: ABC transporter permease [Candidatus Acidoferrales bacterium]|jgi:lipooligosaccharide transport system permease protein|nr:ABC transporter permease [Candidatus Acidoferrales bacterium]
MTATAGGGAPRTWDDGPWAGGGSAGRSALARIARAYEHQALLYRRTWRGSLFNSFFSPTMFLLAMGVGLGSYVDRSGGAATGGVPYLAFLAPGLLAATVMQTASFESTFPVMAGFVWTKRYHAMYATPIGPREILLAQLAWSATRITLVGAIFVLVTLAFGAIQSPLVVLAVPAATLTGLAFATPIAAFAATQRTMNGFSYLFRFGITPLFLFSGTFFPIEQLPSAIQPLAWLTPLYHGVALCRSLALGTVGADLGLALVHLVVLLGFVAVGLVFALRAFERRLAT